MLDIRESFFTQKAVKHWPRLPRAVVESSSLGDLKDMWTWDMGKWWTWQFWGNNWT